jgi:hypothetical protein
MQREVLRERWGELIRWDVPGHRKRHPQLAVAVQQSLRPNEGEPDDVAVTVEADGVAVRRLVEVDRPGGIAHVEVEHVCVSVVLDAVRGVVVAGCIPC